MIQPICHIPNLNLTYKKKEVFIQNKKEKKDLSFAEVLKEVQEKRLH